MKRRDFLQITQAAGIGLIVYPEMGISLNSKSEFSESKVILLKPVEFENVGIPEMNRVAFGWSALGINPRGSIIFKPQQALSAGKDIWLRLTVAQEIRDEKHLHVRIAQTGIKLGILDILYSSVLVPYELKIDNKYVDEINRYGVEITLESPSPLWIFNKTENTKEKSFLPHLLASDTESGAIDDFVRCFLSVNSIQAFGWREGTVLDGLWQVYKQKGNKKALKAIKQHYDLFFDEKQNLVYENGRSLPNDNRIDGIESTLPFATLARLNPNHPILKTVVKGWKELEKDNGMVIDGTTATAEGCYTVAYPMAVIGKIWNDETLKRMAFEQLKCRYVLLNDSNLYLRYDFKGKKYSYKNWARGAAWFLAGFARTISELKNEIRDDEVIDKFRHAVEIVFSMQRDDGLWSCFMDRKEILPDTSGSAGICAAVATGIKDGFLPVSYQVKLDKCWNALQNFITPDGFLKGVAQDNRGGEKLQESDYRVIAQMGMGLMAQFYAARL